VQCTQLGVDPDDALLQVEILAVQAGQLAPAHAGVGGGDDHCTVDGPGDAGSDVVYLGWGGDGSFDTWPSRDADAAAGVVWDAAVLDRLVQDEGQHHQYVGHRPGRQLGPQLANESMPRWVVRPFTE